jgi:dTDP-4-amino-4,6-dideoxygalactose transaminase
VGGALFCKDADLFHQLFYSHNFGHDGPLAFHGLGINGKMSELQAAMGLAVLPYMQEILKERSKVVAYYDDNLKTDWLSRIKIRKETDWNSAYYPVLFESENHLLEIEKSLHNIEVFPRRYFYPSLTNLPYVPPSSCEIASSVSSRILCLPLFYGLNENEVKGIASIINNF